ncbi:MAG: signal peptidase II [Candidatus Acidiferrales bacterium]
MNSAYRIQWFWVALLVMAADQLTKFAVERLTRLDYIQVLVPGFLNLVHTRNPGVAFGLFADSSSSWTSALLITFSAGVMLLLVWLLISGHAGGKLGVAGMALILGGAAGNVLDRLMRQSVTDFIDVHLDTHHWPAFNVADSAIVIGAMLVLFELFRDWRHPSQEKA